MSALRSSAGTTRRGPAERAVQDHICWAWRSAIPRADDVVESHQVSSHHVVGWEAIVSADLSSICFLEAHLAPQAIHRRSLARLGHGQGTHTGSPAAARASEGGPVQGANARRNPRSSTCLSARRAACPAARRCRSNGRPRRRRPGWQPRVGRCQRARIGDRTVGPPTWAFVPGKAHPAQGAQNGRSGHRASSACDRVFDAQNELAPWCLANT